MTYESQEEHDHYECVPEALEGYGEPEPNNTFRESEEKMFDEKFGDIIPACLCIRGNYVEVAPTTPNKVKTFLHDSHKRLVEKIVDGIIGIEIEKDGSDYELAQLRYREKVVVLINQTLK